MPDTVTPRTRWLMLALMVATNALVATMPMSCLPVLFKEISSDLGLSLVQVGSVWGIANLAGLFMSLLAGLLADRFGTRRTLILFALLTALTGAARGLSGSFGTLILTVFLNGAVRLVIPVAVTKNIGLWFRGSRRLGLATGLGMMGMGLGLMLGPLVSASVLSPWLGGWRHVMFFLGGMAGAVALLWAFLAREAPATPVHGSAVSITHALKDLVRVRPIWVMGATLLFRVGCQMGVTGYMPLYLRDFLNWAPGAADGTLSAFYAVSAIVVVPLTFLSDRIGSRRKIMIPALVAAFVSTLLMPFANGALVWVLMITAGMFLDTFMSLTTTLLMESKGIKPEYFGTSIGMIFTMGLVGAVSGPPLGALFTGISGNAPFFFWAALAFMALMIFSFVRMYPRAKDAPALK